MKSSRIRKIKDLIKNKDSFSRTEKPFVHCIEANCPTKWSHCYRRRFLSWRVYLVFKSKYMVTHKVPSIWITWLSNTRKDDTQTITLVSSLWILALTFLKDNDAHFICCPPYLGGSKFNQATFFLWYIPTFHWICLSREPLVSIDTSKRNKDRHTLYCFTMINLLFALR